MFGEISERELSLNDVMAKAWSVYCQKIRAIAMIILCIDVPINIIGYIVIANSSEHAEKTIIALEGFIDIIAVMGIIILVENTIKNDSIQIGWRATLKKAFFRWVSALGTSILALLIIVWPLFVIAIPGVVLSHHLLKEIEPMLFLVIPGIWGVYYVLCYIFIINVVTLRHIGGKAALNYSKSLAKWRWWKSLWIVIVLTLINVGLSFGIGYLSRFLPEVIGIITNFFIEMVYAFSTVAITILFLNLDFLSDRIEK